jgi:DNA invertase Pin-like site-specific DNA recombinase
MFDVVPKVAPSAHHDPAHLMTTNVLNTRDAQKSDFDNRRRAAAYVRMSTDHQKYSTVSQLEAINAYADSRGFQVVRIYEDSGKSGLSLDGREALQRLIREVETGATDFEAILVYDVSRWGRFQDIDESAHYEYVCRKSHISVQYCAEQFENNGSLATAIIKGMKRAMAGEYSRELSVKVFNGHRRLAELGFRQGGPPGFGLRRMLVDQSGVRKTQLARGEHKSIQTDRVILVPGPPEEVENVRRIFTLFVHGHRTERDIAAILNVEGVLADAGRPWSRGAIQQVLTNEKYIGNNVWNRSSAKLKTRRERNAPDMWVRADNVYEGIIDAALFARACGIIDERNRRLSDGEMLQQLRWLFEQNGYLSRLIIDNSEVLPPSSTYRKRFGTLLHAYELVGFRPRNGYEYVEINRTLRRLHPVIICDAITRIESLGGYICRNPATDLLSVNGEFTASMVIARCRQTQAGGLQWKVRLDHCLQPDITVAVRMCEGNRDPLDYYLLPQTEIEGPCLRLAENNGISVDAFRFDDLHFFFGMATRACLGEFT